MALSKDYVSYIATEMAAHLGKSGKAKLFEKEKVSEKIRQVILDDFAREDSLNQEVRDYLEKYSDQIRRDALSYQEMFKLIKKELLKKRGIVRSGGEGGKLPRSKVIELSHQMVKELSGMRHDVELLEPANEVRLELVRRMQELLRTEANIDQGVRQKIHSLKRGITEGSEEWDILFRKYYTEEMRKLGVG